MSGFSQRRAPSNTAPQLALLQVSELEWADTSTNGLGDWEGAPPVSDDAVDLRELGELVRREGALSPARAVRILLRLAERSLDGRGGRADEREQVYWLGAALFFALTGRSPFRCGTSRPSLLSPYSVPRILDTVVQTCLARYGDRFGSTLELCAVLGTIPLDEDVDSGPDSHVRSQEAEPLPTLRPEPLDSEPGEDGAASDTTQLRRSG